MSLGDRAGQARCGALSDEARDEVAPLLKKHGCCKPLESWMANNSAGLQPEPIQLADAAAMIESTSASDSTS